MHYASERLEEIFGYTGEELQLDINDLYSSAWGDHHPNPFFSV